MTMFNIAIKNIKRSFYSYFLYFLSMIFSVVIYFSFQAIEHNKQIAELSKSSIKIDSVFKAASVILAVFVAIFIWYSNSFFTKKRKKEIALYSMLGVKKKQVGRMLFYANIFMGGFALIIGVSIGTLLSKLFTSLLVKVMGLNVNINFAFEPKAVENTIVVFAILFILTSLHGYSLIYRFKLIELFKAENSGEKPPKTSIILAIASILLLVLAYSTALNMFSPEFFIKDIKLRLVILFASILVGTYIFFKSFTTFIVKLSKNNKARYYKSINMIGTSQLQYRLKGNARTLAIISLLSATTLTAIGFTYSLYYSNEKNARTQNPFDIQYVSNKDINSKVTNAIGKDLIKQDITVELLRTPVKFKGKTIPLKLYAKGGEDILYLLSESQYKSIVNILNVSNSEINLKDKKDAVILDSTESKVLKGDYENTKYVLNPKTNAFEITIIERKKFDITSLNTAGLIAVVSDDLFSTYKSTENLCSIRSLNIKDSKNLAIIDKNLQSIFTKDLEFSSYHKDYISGMTSSGVLLFIGMFLGLVFLIATGSIIYFKQLNEANDEKKRYETLRKIGVSNKEIKLSISRQILVVFALPLIIGILHASFALKLFSNLLGTNLLTPVIISFALYTLIYAAYYMLTTKSYYDIVKG